MKHSKAEIGSITLKRNAVRKKLLYDDEARLASPQATNATYIEYKNLEREESVTKSCIHSESFSKDRVNDKLNGCIQTNVSMADINVHKWHKSMDVSVDMSSVCCSSSTESNQGKRVARCWQKQWNEPDQKKLQLSGGELLPDMKEQQHTCDIQVGKKREGNFVEIELFYMNSCLKQDIFVKL